MRSLFVTTALLVALTGCSLTQPAPVKQTFLLDPALPTATTTNATTATTTRAASSVLRINRFVVAQPFDGRTLVYRISDTRYEADYYNEFLAFPATMLTENVIRHLAASRLYQAVVPMTSSIDSKLVLEGAVVHLYGDLRSSGAHAVLGIRFLLARDGGGEILYDRLIERRVAVAARSASALVAGYDAALGQILAELAADLAKHAN